LSVSREEAFAWHERDGALQRLIPPWERVTVTHQSGGIGDGARVELTNRLGPLKLRWIAEHCGYDPPQQFRDIQRSGPFAKWHHTHRFHERGTDASCLEDHIEYVIPGGWLGDLFARRFILRKIAAMFSYRHNVTAEDLAAHAKFGSQETMHVAVTGSSGLVGGDLVPLLSTGGHRVTRLVRGQPEDGQIHWDPQSGDWDERPLAGVDAVVHLAGENIAASRWTSAMKSRIRDSRVIGTRVLCEKLAQLDPLPKTLVAASAIGIYGSRADESLDEDSQPGSGFLAEVARDWEAATQPAHDAGIRVVNLRLGIVLSPKGGALAQLLTPFRMGGGGVVGDGRQYMSWISLDDAVGAIHHALMQTDLEGPVNAVAPQPVTNREFTRTLAGVLNRPAVIPLPAFAARMAFGEMADELLLASARVYPRRLQESRYAFRQETLEGALRHLLGKN
jgi:uncharacterized protein (TIGR01777 family)